MSYYIGNTFHRNYEWRYKYTTRYTVVQGDRKVWSCTGMKTHSLWMEKEMFYTLTCFMSILGCIFSFLFRKNEHKFWSENSHVLNFKHKLYLFSFVLFCSGSPKIWKTWFRTRNIWNFEVIGWKTWKVEFLLKSSFDFGTQL